MALARLGGVVDRRSLLRLCSRHALDAAVAEGSVVRVSRNRYVLPAADEARSAAARVHGVVSHLSAALVHGWKVKVPPARPAMLRDARPRDARLRGAPRAVLARPC